MQLKLFQILERIEHVTQVTYPKIDLNPHSASYVNPSIWGKVAGGGYFSGPIHPDELGMSGAGSKTEIKQISFDIEGTNIRYQPGDRCGILPENSDALIEKTMRALHATVDTAVELHRPWQAALQLRLDYQDKHTNSDKIPLYEFLKFGKIRPVTRNMAKRLCAITALADLEHIVHARAEDQWELWDFFELISNGGFDVRRF